MKNLLLGVVVLESIVVAITAMPWLAAIGNGSTLFFGGILWRHEFLWDLWEHLGNKKLKDVGLMDTLFCFIACIGTSVLIVLLVMGFWGTFSWFR